MNQFYKILILPTLGAVLGISTFAATFWATESQQNRQVEATAGTRILLKADRAFPDTITVKVGETVEFRSDDGKSHNIAVGKGGSDHEHTGSFNSGDFGPDEAWIAEFKESGAYYFHDHYNPNINILVVAYKPSSP